MILRTTDNELYHKNDEFQQQQQNKFSTQAGQGDRHKK